MEYIKQLTKNNEIDSFLFEKSKIAMCFVDVDGKFITANNELVSLLEYTEYELKNMSFADITHPSDLYADLNLFKKVLSGEIDSYPMTKRYITKTGSQIWARLIVTGMEGEDQKVACFFSQIIPIEVEGETTDSLLERVQSIESDKNDQNYIVNFLKKEWKWIIMFGATVIGGYIAWETNRRTEKFETEQRFSDIEEAIEENGKNIEKMIEDFTKSLNTYKAED